MDDEQADVLRFLGMVILVASLVIVTGILLASCATAEAVSAAPEEFWITVDAILAGLLEDFLALVDLFL